MPKNEVLRVHFIFVFTYSVLAHKRRIPCLLPHGGTRVVAWQREVNAEVKVFCMDPERLNHMQRKARGFTRKPRSNMLRKHTHLRSFPLLLPAV